MAVKTPEKGLPTGQRKFFELAEPDLRNPQAQCVSTLPALASPG